jgi:hypothetical protein
MQPRRLVIVGGVAGGASAAARARRLCEQCEIVVFERGPHVSFANCGLPYFVGGEIVEQDSLLSRLRKPCAPDSISTCASRPRSSPSTAKRNRQGARPDHATRIRSALRRPGAFHRRFAAPRRPSPGLIAPAISPSATFPMWSGSGSGSKIAMPVAPWWSGAATSDSKWPSRCIDKGSGSP